MQETQERQVLSLGQDSLVTEHVHMHTHTFLIHNLPPHQKKEAAVYSKYNYFFYKISILFRPLNLSLINDTLIPLILKII